MNDLLIMDMDAGLDIWAGLRPDGDHLLIIVDRAAASLDTAHRLHAWQDIGIRQMSMIPIKYAPQRPQFIEPNCALWSLLAYSLTCPSIQADQDGAAVYNTVPQLAHEIAEIASALNAGTATEGHPARAAASMTRWTDLRLGITRTKVMDCRRRYFDRPIGLVELRISHPRLIRKWPKAGVMDGTWNASTLS